MALLCASAPLRLCAQGPGGLRPVADTSSPPQRPSATAPALVHYGKWATLGGAILLGIRAQQRHADANDAYDALLDSCFAVPTGCTLVGGHYSDPGNELLYQKTRSLDRQAAHYLIGAEVLFAATAAGFVWDLLDNRPRQRNIPFHPKVEPGPDATRVSLTVRF